MEYLSHLSLVECLHAGEGIQFPTVLYGCVCIALRSSISILVGLKWLHPFFKSGFGHTNTVI